MSDSKEVFGATPIFRVPDARAAADYYRDFLGFSPTFSMGEPPTFCKVERGPVAIFLFQTPDTAANTYRSALSEKFADLYVFVKDVDAIHAELSGRGADCLAEPKDYSYGMRDFNIRDLNGYILTFGQEVSR